MIGLLETVKTLLTIRPSKETAITLAILATLLALQIIATIYAGDPIDIIHKR